MISDKWMKEHGAPVKWWWQGKTKVLGEKAVTLSSTNPTWTELGLHLGLCSERPAANCPSHSTTIF